MFRRTLLKAGILLATGAAASCGSPPPLANTHPSPESLAKAVLDALDRRDMAALEALALAEQEFRDHIWPELPAARPERNLPFSYVWGDLRQKSRLALRNTLSVHGGRRYALLGVTFSRETRYPSFVVHHDAALRVTSPEGPEAELRACGSMVSKSGVWKVFSYIVDN